MRACIENVLVPVIPKGLAVSQCEDGIVVRRKWRDWSGAVFSIMWSGLVIRDCTSTPGHGGILFVPLVPWIVYMALASVLDTTKVAITDTGVRCVTRPFYITRDRTASREKIFGILAAVKVRRKGRREYLVQYEDEQGERRAIVTNLKTQEQAEFMALSIREMLGLAETGPVRFEPVPDFLTNLIGHPIVPPVNHC